MPPIEVTAADVALLHDALRTLAADDGDRARDLNGVGFSKHDSDFGHSLAACPRWSPRQTLAAARLVVRYRRQLDPDVVAAAERVAAARLDAFPTPQEVHP